MVCGRPAPALIVRLVTGAVCYPEVEVPEPQLRSDAGERTLDVYSTVTVFARLRGWSTFSPRRRAIR
jgi:hypothetical protein